MTVSRARLLTILCVTAFTAVFLLSWWNRFIGTNAVDGVFVYAAQRMLEGHMPYRDFGLVVPPFEVFVSAAALHFFPGEPFAAVRMLGLLERCVCAVFLTLWLTRIFPFAASLIGAAVSMILFSAAAADPMAGYNQSASTWAVIAGYFASRALDLNRLPASTGWNAFIAGVAAACALLIKQTTGLGLAAAMCLAMVVSLWRLSTPKRALTALGAGVAGWALILGGTFVWLASNDALRPFIDQNFLQGATSKGPLWISLLRPLRMTLLDAWLRQEAVLAVVLVGLVFWLTRKGPEPSQASGTLKDVAFGFLLCVAGLAAGYGLMGAAPGLAALRRVDILERLSVFATLAGCLAMSLVGASRILRSLPPRSPQGVRNAQLWLFAMISLAMAYMHALSFVITDGIMVPGLAFLLALALSNLKVAPGTFAKPALCALLALCFVAISVNAFRKWVTPFGWYGYSDVPVTAANTFSPVPGLRHLRSGAEEVEFNARLVGYLDQYSGPKRESYLFFYLPQLYVLSHTHPVTYSFSPFIDVASDAVARKDAEILRRNPPPVMVYTVVEPAEMERWESEFRAGKPSGQRGLVAAIEEIAKDYDLRDTLYMPGSHRPLRVYTRR